MSQLQNYSGEGISRHFRAQNRSVAALHEDSSTKITTKLPARIVLQLALMLNLFKTPRAREDLLEIWEYIADDNEAQADKFIDKIESKLVILANNPKIGRSRDELSENMRSFSIDKYIVFYKIIADYIVIARVIHGSRDIKIDFFEDEL